MTAASLRQLREESDRLRRRSRVEIAQRLREARAYGDGSNNDEYHAVRAGLRWGELGALRVRDLKLSRLEVNEALKEIKGEPMQLLDAANLSIVRCTAGEGRP